MKEEMILTVFVSIDKDGNDKGIMSYPTGDFGNREHTPMVCSDEFGTKWLTSKAEEVSAKHGFNYRIVRYTAGTDVTDQYKKA